MDMIMTVEELPYLTPSEKMGLRAIMDKAPSGCMQWYLIGSKAKGTFTDSSDIDVVGFYPNIPPLTDPSWGLELINYGTSVSEGVGRTFSLMLFPLWVYNLKDKRLLEELGEHSWLPEAVNREGIYLV